MQIYEIQWKSSEDKKPAWNQAEVSTGAAGRALTMSHCARSLGTHFPRSMEFYEILCKSCRSIENLSNTMKVLRSQEDSLESSRGFYRGSKSSLSCRAKSQGTHTPTSMKINKKLWKSMIIYRIRWKSWEDKKQPGIEQGFYRGSTSNHIFFKQPCPNSMHIYANLCKSMKINENLWKSWIQ